MIENEDPVTGILDFSSAALSPDGHTLFVLSESDVHDLLAVDALTLELRSIVSSAPSTLSGITILGDELFTYMVDCFEVYSLDGKYRRSMPWAPRLVEGYAHSLCASGGSLYVLTTVWDDFHGLERAESVVQIAPDTGKTLQELTLHGLDMTALSALTLRQHLCVIGDRLIISATSKPGSLLAVGI
jgi:hypothetical protein